MTSKKLFTAATLSLGLSVSALEEAKKLNAQTDELAETSVSEASQNLSERGLNSPKSEATEIALSNVPLSPVAPSA